ncbi:DinB family protein [Streptomyces sp. NPDC088785]|uniref:DinB family protein n=1 Tax=Streptomyces sp. NPDC088785 TaxID=3365897 RepID=UPI003810E6A1
MTELRATPDGRPIPPPLADERATLFAWLEFQRATLALKCDGLTDAQARIAGAPPSPLTLLGLVQHLAEVERNWFQRVFAGRTVASVHETPDTFALTADRTLDDALDRWRTEIDQARALTADADLATTCALTDREAAHLGAESVSLRWILTHMIGEYARHNGHADLLREAVDGVTGT